MSWKPEVEVDGGWHQNNLAFETKDEAERSAADLFSRWMLCTGHRAVESDQAVNYRLVDNKLESVEVAYA